MPSPDVAGLRVEGRSSAGDNGDCAPAMAAAEAASTTRARRVGTGKERMIDMAGVL
jgi:hypothetical protein